MEALEKRPPQPTEWAVAMAHIRFESFAFLPSFTLFWQRAISSNQSVDMLTNWKKLAVN